MNLKIIYGEAESRTEGVLDPGRFLECEVWEKPDRTNILLKQIGLGCSDKMSALIEAGDYDDPRFSVFPAILYISFHTNQKQKKMLTNVGLRVKNVKLIVHAKQNLN